MATYQGGSGRDLYTGGDQADLIFGVGGDDKLAGGDGDDTVVGGEGADVLDGGAGDDVLFSSERFEDFGYPYSIYAGSNAPMDRGTEIDRMTGGMGDDYIFAGAGDFVDGGTQGSFGDRLYISFQGASAGVDADFRALQEGKAVSIAGGTIKNIENVGYLEGSEFDDTLAAIDTYYPSGALVYGRGGNDHLIADYYSGWGGSGLWGGDGDDVLDGTGAQYDPVLYGEAGNDIITTYGGSAYGGDGNDTITAGDEAHGGAGDDLITMEFSYYGNQVTGDGGDDEIHAALQGNTISGGDGADVLVGAEGNDTLVSGSFGTYPTLAQEDTGAERDALTGNAGDDKLYAGYGDTVDGGAGNDDLHLSLVGSSTGVRLSIGAITGDVTFKLGGGTITGVETLRDLTATAFADRITLSSHNNVTVHGAGGNDRFATGVISATLFGDDGNDTLVSGAAADHFNGGAGIDTVDYSQTGQALSFALGDGTSTGGTGDTLINVENVIGTRVGDELVGNSFANRFTGGAGADSLSGAGGDDVLDGGAGRDVLVGGEGNDDLFGGTAKDTLTGGAGRDVFHFAEDEAARVLADADMVTDFSQADKEKLDLSKVDGIAGTGQVDPFAFVGTAAFSGRAGELRYEFSGKTTIVSADINDDRVGDVFIRLGGHIALTEKDFVFAKSESAGVVPQGPQLNGNDGFFAHSLLHPLDWHVSLA